MTATPALLALAAAAMLLSACASLDQPAGESLALEEKEYVTGSNLPKRKRVPATDQERERAQEAARVMREEQMRSGSLVPTPGRL
ncbi:hypothetical protein BURK2_02571 [Burkholderiales bacterium]|nr:hypothetical protein BURK2_02571 [Burkholderiales bacterium]